MSENKLYGLMLKGMKTEFPKELQIAIDERVEELEQSINFNTIVDIMAVAIFAAKIDVDKLPDPRDMEDTDKWESLIGSTEPGS